MRLNGASWLRIAGVLMLTGAALALLVAYSGVINIAASSGHFVLAEQFLELGMRRSVQRHSSDIVAPDDLESMDRIRLGAAHFAGGCAECHGAPGSPRNPVYEYMLPLPPDLAHESRDWEANELFFIVRHGLLYTGMPEWSGGGSDDEVWSVVAFLQKLPSLSEDEYHALAAGNLDTPAIRSVETLRADGVTSLARAACDRCHDTPDSAPPSQRVPRLAGQPAAYLARSLHEYRRGERRSGFMQPVAAMLDERQVEQLAIYYSEMPSTAPADENMSATSLSLRDAELLANGDHPDLRIPACLSCHTRNARADYPLLQGQQAEYIAQQLQLWKNGGRRQSAWGEVMAMIATRLDATQIDVLAQWFSQQPDPGPAERRRE